MCGFLDLKVEHEVLMYIRNWEQSTGRRFLMCDLPFEDYIKKQRDDFQAEKENERLQRVRNGSQMNFSRSTPF